MIEHVSVIFAFVLQNGATAEEILFAETPLPGMTEQEREAVASIEPHLRESWIGLLTACRAALWAISAGHPCAPAMQRPRARPSTMYEKSQFHVTLVPGRATCGVSLDPWGKPQYHLFVWVWVDEPYLAVAERVVGGLKLPIWRNQANMGFVITLDAPQEGERFVDVGQRTAEHLWQLARPIADAVRGSLS